MYTVYKHTTPNNKVYIGITCQTPKERWQRGKGYKSQPYFYNAIQKYGWDNIKHEILYTGLTQEEAHQKEIELIKEYQSNHHSRGYNISGGGELGFTKSIYCLQTDTTYSSVKEAAEVLGIDYQYLTNREVNKPIKGYLFYDSKEQYQQEKALAEIVSYPSLQRGIPKELTALIFGEGEADNA